MSTPPTLPRSASCILNTVDSSIGKLDLNEIDNNNNNNSNSNSNSNTNNSCASSATTPTTSRYLSLYKNKGASNTKRDRASTTTAAVIINNNNEVLSNQFDPDESASSSNEDLSSTMPSSVATVSLANQQQQQQATPGDFNCSVCGDKATGRSQLNSDRRRLSVTIFLIHLQHYLKANIMEPTRVMAARVSSDAGKSFE